MQVQISAVIITFNEEKNIARCIDSLKDIADEILVVDSFSTDKTEELCKERNVRFIQHKFEGHIEQKNYAMEQAEHDVVLSLDADEAVNDELKKSILAVKSNWKHQGYSMNRLTNYCGQWIRHCGWYPDVKMRLWNRNFGRWEGTNPHDRMVLDPKKSAEHLSGDLLHYSFYTVEEHKAQIRYFTDIAAKAMHKEGKRSNWLKIIVHPFAQFIKGFLLKQGFLDGKNGFVICWLSAHANYLKYSKLLQIQKQPSS